MKQILLLTTEPGYKRQDEEIQNREIFRFFAIEGEMVYKTEIEATNAGKYPNGIAYTYPLAKACITEQKQKPTIEREDYYHEQRRKKHGMYGMPSSTQYGDASTILPIDIKRAERRLKKEECWKYRQNHLSIPINGTGQVWPTIKFICKERKVPQVGFIATCFLGDNTTVAIDLAYLCYKFFCIYQGVSEEFSRASMSNFIFV